jgi:hypothetical protein
VRSGWSPTAELFLKSAGLSAIREDTDETEGRGKCRIPDFEMSGSGHWGAH